MSGSNDRDILNIEEAAQLLGVSIKTFNKVLHSERLPARKIGREWKFSRQALIDWVGSGTSDQFYREGGHQQQAPNKNGDAKSADAKSTDRRTSGWRLELD